MTDKQLDATVLVDELLHERRRDRRFKYIRLVVIAALVTIGVALNYQTRIALTGTTPTEDYAAVVRLNGTIMPDGEASANHINPALVAAFEDSKAEGVVLVVNSPGGTPVQSALIHDRIVALRKEHPNKKFVVVAEDMLTSGAYFVSVAADTIYANRSTVTGSIGVIMQSFGFNGLMDHLGVERRVLTAGTRKSQMDPFLPLTETDIEKAEDLLSHMHNHFIETVQAGRGDRLKASPEALFTGDYWTGDKALELGLIDGLSDLPDVLRSEFGVTKIKDYTPSGSLFSRIGKSLSRAMAELLTAQSAQSAAYLPR